MDINFANDVIKTSFDKPVLAQFSADWCGPCRVMKPVVMQVKSSRKDFEWVVVDVDKNPEPSMNYGIRGIPTIMLFSQGKVVGKYPGGFSAVKLNGWMNDVLGNT